MGLVGGGCGLVEEREIGEGKEVGGKKGGC